MDRLVVQLYNLHPHANNRLVSKFYKLRLHWAAVLAVVLCLATKIINEYLK